MDTYSLLRQFADSWFLIVLTVFFLGVVLWAFRPGSRALHDDAARAPFRHDDAARAAFRDDAPPGDKASPSRPASRSEANGAPAQEDSR